MESLKLRLSWPGLPEFWKAAPAHLGLSVSLNLQLHNTPEDILGRRHTHMTSLYLVLDLITTSALQLESGKPTSHSGYPCLDSFLIWRVSRTAGLSEAGPSFHKPRRSTLPAQATVYCALCRGWLGRLHLLDNILQSSIKQHSLLFFFPSLNIGFKRAR